MIFTEIKGDLFTVEPEFYMAHCISRDYALGKGIAKEFNKRFHLSSILRRENRDEKYTCILCGKVFNLVTKKRYFNKPTYDSLFSSLIEMRTMCRKLEVKKLAMPRIGCGLDKLSWPMVRDMIKDVFKNDDIEIRIYYNREW